MVSSGVASLIIASWPGGKVRSNLFPWRTQLRKPHKVTHSLPLIHFSGWLIRIRTTFSSHFGMGPALGPDCFPGPSAGGLPVNYPG